MISMMPITKLIFKGFLPSFFLFFSLGQYVLAQDHTPVTHYVSPQGNDINDGLSESRPLKDLAGAIYRMRIGDTLVVLPGEYTVVDFRAWPKDPTKNKMYLSPEGGSKDTRTTIRGKTGSPRPKISAQKADGTISGIQFKGAVGVTLDYLDIHGGVGYGSHMIYRNCIIGGPGTVYGISAEHHDSLIENNYFHDIYGGGDAIGIYISGDRNTIRNNFFKNIAHHGFQTAGANDLVIEGNFITQTKGHGIAFRDMNDSIIRNNVLVNVGSQAISFGGSSNKNVKVVGNTIYNGDGKGYYGLFFINDNEGLVVENNIIVHRTAVAFLRPEIQLTAEKLRSYTFRNNLYFNPYRSGETVFFPTNNTNNFYGVEGWREYTANITGDPGQEQGSIYGDPLVVKAPSSGSDYLAWDDSSTIDLQLTPSSPAVDAGIDSSFLATDVNGNERPFGAGTDMGAFEFGGQPAEKEVPSAPTNLRIGSF